MLKCFFYYMYITRNIVTAEYIRNYLETAVMRHESDRHVSIGNEYMLS